MKLKLDKRDFGSFLQSLIDQFDLYAPVELAEGVSAYQKIDQPDEVKFSILNPQKPLKEVFFPQSEVMFCYGKVGKKNQVTPTEEIERERVILGARSCDIEAISLMDEVYFGERIYGRLFQKQAKGDDHHRNGLRRSPLHLLLLLDRRRSFVRKGSDLFFIDLGDAYLVEGLTEKGKRFQDNKYFKEALLQISPWPKRLRRRHRRRWNPRLRIAFQSRESRRNWMLSWNPFLGQHPREMHRLQHLYLPLPDLPLFRYCG